MEVKVNANAPGYLNHAEEKHQDEDLLRKCSASEDGVDSTLSTTMTDRFDCNICLDFVVEPVVTLCGHLYCWPCIYKWLQVESSSSRQCPVCKAPLSQDMVIPLYGRGGLGDKSESEIPHRSSLHHQAMKASGFEQRSPRRDEHVYGNLYPSIPHPQLHRHYHYYPSHSRRDYVDTAVPSSLLPAPVFHSSTGGLVGGLLTSILPWVFRNQDMSMYYSRRYHLTVSGNSPRLRRHQMQVESSLHQTWLFLLCFAILCLLFL